jgi:hypothetical protein
MGGREVIEIEKTIAEVIIFNNPMLQIIELIIYLRFYIEICLTLNINGCKMCTRG